MAAKVKSANLLETLVLPSLRQEVRTKRRSPYPTIGAGKGADEFCELLETMRFFEIFPRGKPSWQADHVLRLGVILTSLSSVSTSRQKTFDYLVDFLVKSLERKNERSYSWLFNTPGLNTASCLKLGVYCFQSVLAQSKLSEAKCFVNRFPRFAV